LDENPLEHAALEGFEVHRGLVGVDLGDGLTPGHLVPRLLEPPSNRPLLHRVGETGHQNFGQLSP
jgi:hypothetical protein